MTNPRNRSGKLRPRLDCRPLILERAATPDGFTPLEARHLSANLHRVCRLLVGKGLLFAAAKTANGQVVRYFTTQAAARAFGPAPRPSVKAPASAAATTGQAAVRQIISEKAGTPEGYRASDTKGMQCIKFAANHVLHLVATGALVRVKVPGHRLRFVKTQAMADALAEVLRERKPNPRYIAKPVHARKPQAGPLRLLLLGTGPQGITHAEALHLEGYPGAFSKCAQQMIASGLLFRAKVTGWHYRYFRSQAEASAWEAATPARVMPRKGRGPSKVKKAKKARPPRSAKQEMQVVQRKAYSPPAPSPDAEIVHTAQTRYSSRAMGPGRYEVSVPFVRIGQPGFSMSLGG